MLRNLYILDDILTLSVDELASFQSRDPSRALHLTDWEKRSRIHESSTRLISFNHVYYCASIGSANTSDLQIDLYTFFLSYNKSL